jgi:hypothetical protein
MTTEEMTERLIERVRQMKSGVSFVDLVDAIGEEARGEHSIESGLPQLKNIVWWSGLSETFIAAFASREFRDVVEPYSCSVLVYMFDGAMLGLPLAKRQRPYKKPHWMPMTFALKKMRGERKCK